MKDERSYIKTVSIYGLLGIVIGSSFTAAYFSNNSPFSTFEVTPEKRAGLHGFINPVLECAAPVKGYGLKSYAIAKRLEEMKNEFLEREKSLDNIYLYFKDLNNGPTFGINETHPIRGGSLTKIPLMIGYLKVAESEPGYLERKITFKDEALLELYEFQGIGPESRLVLNQSYTLRTLIDLAIIQSDNVATAMLKQYNNNESLRRVAKEMDMPVSTNIFPYREMTIQDYAGFFRILYNSTYLNRESSNRALDLLNRIAYKGGIRAGVPKSVPVAHKFGENPYGKNGTHYFSDCGIVYHPRRPFLLCMSTRGRDSAVQQRVIKEFSELIFHEVDSI